MIKQQQPATSVGPQASAAVAAAAATGCEGRKELC